MCDTDDRADVAPAESLPASLEWKGEVLPLEPVDELSVLTVWSNSPPRSSFPSGGLTHLTA